MTIVNLPSWVVAPLKGADPSATDNHSHMTEVSASESIPIIHSFVHSSSSVAAAKNLRGKEAQSLIDAIDQVGAIQS